MTAHTTRGSLVEVRTTRESWQRGVVVRAEPDCDMLLVRLRSGASTAWTFGDVCRPDSAPRKPAASPAASSSGAAASSSGAAVGTAPPTAAGMGFVEQPQAGQCVGTLRWDDRKQFPPLPAWPAECAGTPPALVGWRDYLEMRLPPDGEGTIRVEPPMLDGASYPLSLLHALQELRLRPPSHEPLTVLLIGASSKAEARLLHDSNYWCELAHFLPAATLHLVFVGPEIDATSGAPMQLAPRLSAECVRGTLGALLQARPQLSAANSLLVGFNTGMGNGLLALMQSWLPDLHERTSRSGPLRGG